MITHVTLNTGHVTEVTRDLEDHERAACAALWPKGGLLPPPFSAFRVDFGGEPGAASFALWRGREPLIINVVCWSAGGAAEAWAAVESQYLQIAEMPLGEALGTEYTEPPATPWLATLLLPTLMMSSMDDIAWMGSFEQSMALYLTQTHQPS